MATYKVIQDIEADDHLIGNLSFRQFVYALIAVFMIYVSYLGLTKHASFILIFTAPVALFTGFLAYPFGKDQPTEVWALARLRFLIKPRRRVWAQSGVKELVTITVPKKVEIDLTDGLSQNEVKSRLQALANTIDSRGWAVKNVGGIYQNPLTDPNSDRLVNASAMPQTVPEDNFTDSDDVLDVSANPAAQQMNQLLNANGQYHRQQLMQELSNISQAQVPTQAAATPITQTQAPTPDPASLSVPAATNTGVVDEAGLADELEALRASQHSSLNNMRTLRPGANQQDNSVATPVDTSYTQATSATTTDDSQVPDPASTKPLDPVIMNLAQRNDLNVTVIAHEANKAKAPNTRLASNDEVLISLH